MIIQRACFFVEFLGKNLHSDEIFGAGFFQRFLDAHAEIRTTLEQFHLISLQRAAPPEFWTTQEQIVPQKIMLLRKMQG
jgi:hypothetical protein